MSFLLQGNVPYEFRTTVARELHSKEDILSIGDWLAGADAYYLQAYRESEQVIDPVFSSYSYEELTEFQTLLKTKISTVEIRGIDT